MSHGRGHRHADGPVRGQGGHRNAFDARRLPPLDDLLQRAIDERRDPRDDDACVQRLLDDPAALRAFATLQARLSTLEGSAAGGTAERAPAAAAPTASRRRAPRRSVTVAAVLAAAAAVALATLLPLRPGATAASPAVPAARALPPPVLEYHPPLARAAAEVRVREDLIHDATTRLVVVETRSYSR
jgi:hypothetical protein